jgi:hypothetical protein
MEQGALHMIMSCSLEWSFKMPTGSHKHCYAEWKHHPKMQAVFEEGQQEILDKTQGMGSGWQLHFWGGGEQGRQQALYLHPFSLM